jgi:DNA-binding NarL/FixJ family response regulator
MTDPIEQPGNSEAIPVVLVDDHTIWRGGVRSMLEDSEFVVVGEAGSGRQALEVIRETLPRLVLLDIRMAGGDGLDTLQALKAEHPQISVLMLTTYDNPTYMARALAGGAAGYLLKGIDRDALLIALRAVANGEVLLKPEELTRSLRSIGVATSKEWDMVEPLTDREVEVLRLLTTGINNRDLAALLFVAESTVKTHVEHIIGKLGVSDRVQAAVWAVRHGIAAESVASSH